MTYSLTDADGLVLLEQMNDLWDRCSSAICLAESDEEFESLYQDFINSQKALEDMMTAGTGGSMEMARAAGKTTTSVQLATMVVTVVPIMCLYPFLQKYFVKGVMVGSIKG